jgi:hypothetical protein
MASDVILCGPDYLQGLAQLLHDYGITVDRVADGAAIPGSFWGDSEAGLIGDHLFVRRDTPLHSALHEACHFICMDGDRRAQLHTDAGGDVAEENAVCYLQGLLADEIAGFKRARLFADMDTWGYTFRLGSARTWFEQDASDARDWLIAHRIIDNAQRRTGALRR